MTQPSTQSDYSRAVVTAAALYTAAKTRPESNDELSAMTTTATAAIAVAMLTTSTRLKTRWRSVDPYDDTAVLQFAVDAGRIVVPAQQSVARVTAAAQTRILRSVGVPVTVTPKVPTDVRSSTPSGEIVRRGPVRVAYTAPNAPAEETTQREVAQAESDTSRVFERAAVTYRFRRAEGATAVEAQTAAEQRIDAILDGNLQIARAVTEFQAMQQAKAVDLDRVIVGYRRVIHPEMSRGGVCGMCIVAADRVYNIETLKAIHYRCWCTVLPKFEDYDPGREMNRDDLRKLYKNAGGTTRKQLKRTRYTIEEHSELGPMLVPAKGSPVPYFSVPADPAA